MIFALVSAFDFDLDSSGIGNPPARVQGRRPAPLCCASTRSVVHSKRGPILAGGVA